MGIYRPALNQSNFSTLGLYEFVINKYQTDDSSENYLFARETSRACIEFPGLYRDLQTGFEPVKFLNTWSVRVCH